MTSQKERDESSKLAQERLAEIGQILYIGIKRLKLREASKNNLNQLDSKLYRSVHGINNNRRISAL